MNKMLAIAGLLLVTAGSFAGTNKDTGEVCQGSTCTGGDGEVTSTITGVTGTGVVAAYPDDIEIKNVPDLHAPSINPTVDCAIPYMGAGVGSGWGLSLGSVYVDENCEMREMIRLGLEGDAESNTLANKLIQMDLEDYIAKKTAAKEEAKKEAETSDTTWAWQTQE